MEIVQLQKKILLLINIDVYVMIIVLTGNYLTNSDSTNRPTEVVIITV